MEKQNQIYYTATAKERLEKLKADFIAQVESALIEGKFIPGEKEIEITGSDIEDLSRSMKVVFGRRYAQRNEWRQLIVTIYFVIGVFAIIVGVFYPNIKPLFLDQVRVAFIVSGIFTILAAVVMRYYLKVKEKMRDEVEEFRSENLERIKSYKFESEELSRLIDELYREQKR